MDQPLPAIAKEIQWLWSDSLSNNNIVIMIRWGRVGVFMLRWPGEWLNGSGWPSAITTAGTVLQNLLWKHLILRGQDMPTRLQLQRFLFCSRVNWTGKRTSTLCWKKWTRECIAWESWDHSDMLVTFYNAVICSIIMFGSVCWGGSISKLDKGRIQKIVKNAGHVVEKGQF